MKKISLYILGLIIIGFLVFVSFNSNTGDSEQIKVGAVFSMTGFGQLFGEETQRGFNLCKNDNVELIIEDSQSTPASGVSAFNKLVNIDNPDIILVMVSSIAEATLPLVANYDGPVLATSVVVSDITNRGGQKYFRYFVRGETESRIASEYMLNELQVSRPGILYLNSDYGKTYLEGLEEIFKDNGDVISEPFNQGTTDFKTHILKLKDRGADAIYIVGYDNDVIIALKDIQNVRYDGVIFTNSIFTNIIDKLDSTLLNGVYFSALRFETAERGDVFFEDYKEKYGNEATWYASMGCDIARQINLSKDKDLLKHYLNLDTFSGLNGNIRINGREFEILSDIAIYQDGIEVLKITE